MKAEHNGTGSTTRVVQSSFRVYFIDQSELPYFEKTKQLINITENEENVCEIFNNAIDNKCLQNPDDCYFRMYYYQMNQSGE